MRSTVTIDDETFNEAAALTGITKLSEIVQRAFEELIRAESSRRLASLGGSMSDASAAPRNRRALNANS